MKKILIIIFLFSSFTGHSQTSQVELHNNNIDCYGMKIRNTPIVSNSIYKQMSVQSVLQYDSIRALTEINDVANSDAYPWISPDGLRLYFTRGTGGSIPNQLMFTERVNTNSYFGSPVVVPLGFPTITSCWLSSDELNIYLCMDSTLYFASRTSTSSPFNSPVAISLTGYSPFSFLGGISLNVAQDQLFVSLYNQSTGIFISVFTRTSATSFSYVRTLNAPGGYLPKIGHLSKDDLTYFFSAGNGNTILCQANRTAPTDSFDLNLLQQIAGINDMNTGNNQPSMSDSLNWVVFVRNNTNIWSGNDLYIARRDVTTSLSNEVAPSKSVTLFPNPTSGQFTISVPTIDAEIRITDILGQQITETSVTQLETNFHIAASGVYLVYIQTKNGTSRQTLVVSK
ncbi:MAG TPA: T9SS type A sorting domain-containing protein [Bacteroidia bacterium]|nr:T9SS type A sorting domain-containing protein [Bacteroidia bacterium]